MIEFGVFDDNKLRCTVIKNSKERKFNHMYKTEIICDGCESHYIVVTKKKDQINFCPFCSEPYSYDEQNEDDNVEEDESL